MSDRIEGDIRDSDIKIECRRLLNIVPTLHLTREQTDLVLAPINNIIKYENKRLDSLKVVAKNATKLK